MTFMCHRLPSLPPDGYELVDDNVCSLNLKSHHYANSWQSQLETNRKKISICLNHIHEKTFLEGLVELSS